MMSRRKRQGRRRRGEVRQGRRGTEHGLEGGKVGCRNSVGRRKTETEGLGWTGPDGWGEERSDKEKDGRLRRRKWRGGRG